MGEHRIVACFSDQRAPRLFLGRPTVIQRPRVTAQSMPVGGGPYSTRPGATHRLIHTRQSELHAVRMDGMTPPSVAGEVTKRLPHRVAARSSRERSACGPKK